VGTGQWNGGERVKSTCGYELYFEILNKWHMNNQKKLTVFKCNSHFYGFFFN
jgi:hypothetical protein